MYMKNIHKYFKVSRQGVQFAQNMNIVGIVMYFTNSLLIHTCTNQVRNKNE